MGKHVIYRSAGGVRILPAEEAQKLITAETGASDDWENTSEELNVVTTCGHAPKEPMTLTISRLAKAKIDILMKQYKSIEWLAYLLGDWDTKMITDITIPKQEVSSADVKVLGPSPIPNTIGVIHSHHNMGAFFSGTDINYINGNHKISIVVSHNGSKAQVVWETPCGSKTVVEAKVVVEKDHLFDEDAFLEDAIENILERSFSPPVYNQNFGNKGVIADRRLDEKFGSGVQTSSWGSEKWRRGNEVGIRGMSVGNLSDEEIRSIVDGDTATTDITENFTE